MFIYCYCEHTHQRGAVAGEDLLPESEGYDYPNSDSDDVFLWGEGSREELIAQARERLAVRYDTRPGGAGDAFAWTCASSVLDWLGDA